MVCTRTHSSLGRTAAWALLLLVLIHSCRAQRQPPADCSGGNATICNDNSSCDSNEMCECDQSYFSPSGTNTDCRAQRQPPADCSGGNAAICSDNSSCDSNEMCECDQSYFSPSGTNTDCRRVDEVDPRCADYDTDCVFCGSNFEGPCMRCLVLLLEFTNNDTECVTECPNGQGFHIDVLDNTMSSITARICDGTFNGGQSSSLPQWAVIVIPVMAGIMLITCVVLVSVFACTVLSRSSTGQFDVEDDNMQAAQSAQSTLRTRRTNSFNYQKQTDIRESRDSSYFTAQENPSFTEREGSEEEVEFLQKLDYLRTQAQVFLRMLNDMRRRLKELPPDAAAAKQYRNVMRDVTRLLYLVNKKPSAVQMPPDGNQLLDWSQQILERYLKSHGQSPQAAPADQPSRLSAIGDQDETQF